MTVLTKTEVNLRRLLAAAPQHKNQLKLIHNYWKQLAEEKTLEGLPRISKGMVNEYSEKIEAIAAKLATHVSDVQVVQEPIAGTSARENPSKTEGESIHHSSGLRRRSVAPLNVKEGTHDIVETDRSVPVMLDASAQTHIGKHRKLQEDLTDEMVVLVRQLKESGLMMSQSLKNTEKILDSTEKAVEHSLASTGHALWRYTPIVSRLHASRGLRSL